MLIVTTALWLARRRQSASGLARLPQSVLEAPLEMTSICVVDAEGLMVCETKVLSEPEAIAACLTGLPGCFERVGLEAGPLSQWLYFGLRDAGLPVVCIETRHSKAAIAAMSMNKTDSNDGRSLAQLVRSGWLLVPFYTFFGGGSFFHATNNPTKAAPLHMWAWPFKRP